MRIDIAFQTDRGRRKAINEDYYGVFRDDMPGLQLFSEGALLCVADGLGGHVAGDVASKLAVAVIKDMLREPPPPTDETEADQGYLPVLTKWIRAANENLYRTNQDLVKKGRPMGTTLLVSIVTPKKVYIGNVGDSRCYHIRDGDIIAKTEDHSWVDEQVKLGLMSKSEAESDARKSLVTRSIGTHPEVPVDGYIWHVVPGDMLLLCTDGLVNMVKESDIRAVFRRRSAPADIAQELVNLANDNGGKDNITVIVADISPSRLTVLYRRIRAFSRKRYAKALFGLLLLAFGAMCFWAGYWLRGKSP